MGNFRAMGCIRVLLCIYVILVMTRLNAQPPANINSYLKNPGIPKAAKLFYEGKIKTSDDSITYSLIDSLNTKITPPGLFIYCLFRK